ncbi:MAG: insulinase family protein [Duncaniella sp.]|nr:insulinase family protein [Duncaniella sp.]
MTPDRTIPPEIQPMPMLTMPEPEVTLLPSGATLYSYSGGDSPVTRISVALAGGLVDRPSPEAGALIAPLWIEGSRGMDAEAIADYIDYRGAWINADMGIRSMNLTVSALNNSVAEIIPVIGGIISAPAFEESRLQQMARRTAASLGVEQSTTAWNAGSALRSLVYGAGHPLQCEPDPSRLDSVTSGQLTDYYRSLLSPANLSVFLSGKLTDDTIVAVSRMLEEIPSTGPRRTVDVPAFNPSAERRTHISMPQSQQSAVRMGLVLPGRENPDFVMLRLLVLALGGYFGSRLMLNVREDKGYTYGINAVTIGYPRQAYMSISAEADAAYVEPLITETIAEMERMKDESSYTADEIDRLRRISLSNLAAMIDTPFTIMDHHRSSILAGAPAGYFAQQQDAVLNLSAECLAALARKYFDTSRLYIATAGA